MTSEQHVVRWVLLVPTLALLIVFPPARGGQFQLWGWFDTEFLAQGMDWFRLIVILIALVIGFALLEQYAMRSMELQDTRPRRRGGRYANTSVEMTPIRASLLVLLLLVCGTVPVAFAKIGWENAQISRVTTAAKSGDLRGLQSLLKLNGNLLQAKGFLGRTPLFWAAYGGAEPVIRYLVEQQADINVQDERGWTPLHAAASRNRAEALKTLLDLGAKKTAVDKEGNTPVHIAAQGPNQDAIDVLVSQGFDIDAQNTQGRTPLHVAAERKEILAVKKLIELNAQLNIKDKSGLTPLGLAHQLPGNSTVSQELVDSGGNE